MEYANQGLNVAILQILDFSSVRLWRMIKDFPAFYPLGPRQKSGEIQIYGYFLQPLIHMEYQFV